MLRGHSGMAKGTCPRSYPQCDPQSASPVETPEPTVETFVLCPGYQFAIPRSPASTGQQGSGDPGAMDRHAWCIASA